MTASADTGLTGAHEGSERGVVDGLIHIEVVEHDNRCLAAEFECLAGEVRGRRCASHPPGFRATGQNQLADPRMAGQRPACHGAVSGHHVEDTGGRPASENNSAKRSVVSGVYSDGLTTVVHPDAKVGARFRQAMRSG